MRPMILALLSLLVAGCSSMGPETAAVEELTILSFTPATGPDLPVTPLVVDGKLTVTSKPLEIPGELYLPKQAAQPMPAVILIHGSGGLGFEGPHLRDWAGLLNSWGVAALIIDTYRPRGVNETVSDQDRVSYFAQVADAFAALNRLGADPRIDRNRIGIMGFSRGSIIVNDTAFETVRQGFGGGNMRFAAHIALYSPCNIALVDRATDKAPMLFLHGEADSFTPVEPCRDYAKLFERLGNSITFVSYPGALHGFDSAMAEIDLPSAPTSGSCDARYDIGTARFTRLNHVDNPQLSADAVRKYLASCVGKGAAFGGDDKARADAIEQVHRFVVATLHAR
jgi:dienelactone hydrolase